MKIDVPKKLLIANKPPCPGKQMGSVIIVVLWTSVLLTILVTVMASKVRLSAQTAWHNQVGVTDWANIVTAVNQAEMELMLERMPIPVGVEQEESEDGEIRIPAYRFNGQALELHYPAQENMVVRIFDHAGKINLNRIPRRNMQLLIQNMLGEDYEDEQVEELLAAWTDWTDLNDLEGLNGAEEDYYQSLDQPYTPRNNPELDTVEEIRLVRGFDELFKDVNLEAAFTIYGSSRTVNLNLATREAMQILPGLDEELIELILYERQFHDFRNKGDVGEIVPLEQMVELSSWIGNNTSSIYSIYAYPKMDVEEFIAEGSDGEYPGEENLDLVSQAYMEIVEIKSYNNRARVYKVDPYGELPDMSPPRVVE